MAKRPAWKYDKGKKKIFVSEFEFKFNPGFSITQKKRNVVALHESIGKKTLEVSTKSFDVLGKKLSAFNLKLDSLPLECIFQSSKRFEYGGPYTDLLYVTPKDAKRDERLKNSGKLISFEYKGKSYPIVPKTAFYDYIYVNAVKETLDISDLKEILNYEYFTDIEFNPLKSINCQAKSVAIIKAMLMDFGEIPNIDNFDEFLRYYQILN